MLTAAELSKKIKAYRPEADTEIVERAYVFARKAHAGQKRFSGEPYFSHPVATARNLIHMQLDPVTVAAGLLHDVPEDTEVILDQIREEFGDEVAFLVDGVTKVSKVRLGPAVGEAVDGGKSDAQVAREQAAVENLRKMLLAMAQDIRVVLIKLADRLHNMQTLSAVPQEKQYRIAKETLEVYAPLAERLGMGEMRGELQDLAFPYVDQEGYQWVKQLAGPLYREMDRYLRRVMQFVERDLQQRGIEASVHGRAKHLYSLYRKLLSDDRDITKIYDLIAVRILVNDVPACYEVLGLLHQHWKPLVGRIKDYIAVPKPNGYQSLHTTVFCLDGRIVEFQVRTFQMHREDEYGIAAHWSYKEGVRARGGSFDWVQQLAQWQQEVSSNQEFLDALKIDTFEHRIFVFTPKGEVRDLPAGAMPLDFAYTVHSDVGNHCVGAKVNGKLVTLTTPLQNGDVVEIKTSAKASPKVGWLDMASTASARSHIRKALREMEAEEEQVVEVAAEANGRPVSSEVKEKAKGSEGEVRVEGNRGYLVRLAKCCNPQVGDSIVGIVTVGEGVSVHQRWCPNVRHVSNSDRVIQVTWEDDERQRVQLKLEAYDRRGLTRDIASILAQLDVNILALSVTVQENGTGEFNVRVDMPASTPVEVVIDRLQALKNIYLVSRE